MKNFSFLILFIFTLCHSIFSQNLVEKINGLRNYYNLSMSDTSVCNKILFFNIFPNNFSEFHTIYGYNDSFDSIEYSPLYLEAAEHICFFCTLSNIIPLKQYYRKMIDIAINGHWQADAISNFQSCLFDHVLLESDTVIFYYNSANHDSIIYFINPAQEVSETLLSVLETYKDEDIASFWHFYFDKSPMATEFSNVYYKKTRKMLVEFPRLYTIMIKELKKQYDN